MEVIAEGLFTKDEINSAMGKGVIVKITNGRYELCFPTERKYEEWMNEQRRLHPNRWSDAIRISAKTNTR
jgi:hypothetical protein